MLTGPAHGEDRKYGEGGPPWGHSQRVRKVHIGGKDAPLTCARGGSCEPAAAGGFPCTNFEGRCRTGEIGLCGARPALCWE